MAQALAAIGQRLLDPANRFIDRTRPFELVKRDPDACRRALVQLADALRVVAILLKPFMPATAERIYGGFNHPVPFASARFDQAAPRPAPAEDLRVTASLRDGKVPPLVPRIEGTPGAPPADAKPA
jgi:methionyl-tRNA synthetase